MSASLYCWSGAKGFLADAIACCIPNENGFVLGGSYTCLLKYQCGDLCICSVYFNYWISIEIDMNQNMIIPETWVCYFFLLSFFWMYTIISLRVLFFCWNLESL